MMLVQEVGRVHHTSIAPTDTGPRKLFLGKCVSEYGLTLGEKLASQKKKNPLTEPSLPARTKAGFVGRKST